MIQDRLESSETTYSYGPYNKWNNKEQWIRLTEGCPHNCPFCYEPTDFKVFKIPEIKRNIVKIMDMNLLSKPQALEILNQLPTHLNKKIIKYHFICGLDYRFLTVPIVARLRELHVPKIRLAWDWYYKDQYEIKKAIDLLKKYKWKPFEIMVFMLCNWKISFEENLKKMDLCKVWGVQISDCYFDNQVSPRITPVHWNATEIKTFRRKTRKHNQLVNFKIDPQIKWGIT